MAVIAALATIALAEAGARWLRHRDPVAHSYEAPRNPHFRRDWLRYTAPRPRPDGHRLVIVIGNSQGFLREERDGKLTWPARLQAGLNQGGDDVIVANWSVPAGNCAEMILLAARAAAHRPDVVLVSPGRHTFANPTAVERPLAFWLSDAATLAYLPSVRRLLTPDFLKRTQAYDLSQALRAWSALAWFRSRQLEDRKETWTWAVRKPRRVRRLPARKVSSEAVSIQLRELADALHSESRDTQLLIVQMPLAPSGLDSLGRQRALTTSRTASRLFAGEARIHVATALDLVPDRLFYIATHMDPDGHEMYARWLEPQVRQLLNR